MECCVPAVFSWKVGVPNLVVVFKAEHICICKWMKMCIPSLR